MKTRILLPVFALWISALGLPAATLTWLASPLDSNWFNPANWDTSTAPLAGDALILGQSKSPYVVINGQTASAASISFPATPAGSPVTRYTLDILNGAKLTLTGAGIINRTPSASTTTNSISGTDGTGQTVHIDGGSTLEFVNSASASSGVSASANRVRMVNNDGAVNFRDTSTAGSLFYFNVGPVRGGPAVTLAFYDTSNAGNAQIRNRGEHATVLFTDNSSTRSVLIYNSGANSLIRFNGSSTLNATGRIFNNGNGAQTHFNENAKLYGNQTFNTEATGGVFDYRDPGTDKMVAVPVGESNANSLADIINNGTYASVSFVGEKVRAENLSISNNGYHGIIHMGDGFSATDLYIGCVNRSTTAYIEGVSSIITLNGSVFLQASGTKAGIYIGNNVEITSHGNFTANGGSTVERSWVTISGNASVKHNGNAMPLTFRASGTSFGSNFTINGNANILNAGISIDGGRNPAVFDPANPNSANIFNIAGNATFTTNRPAYIGGNFGYLNISENATYVTSNIIVINGAYGHLDIFGNATVKATDVINGIYTSGRDASVAIYGHADVTISNFRIATTNSTLSIGGHANVTLTGLAGSNGNGVIGTASAADTKVTIGGNATITGFSAANNTFSLSGANATITVGGHAKLRDGRIDLYDPTSSMSITGSPVFENFTILSRSADRAITVAMDKDHSITLANLTQVTTGNYLTLHFTGNTGQTVQYDGLGNNQPYLAFTEDPGVRATVIHNAAYLGDERTVLKLDHANTITGEFVIKQGQVRANHPNALDTATVKIMQGANLSFGPLINAAKQVTLGGLSGNGTLNAWLPDIFIGNNSYDSEFTGTLISTGTITKIGDGTLSLKNITTTSYTGQVAVAAGALRIDGAVTLPALALGTGTRLLLTLADDNNYARLTVGSLSLDNASIALHLADTGDITLSFTQNLPAILATDNDTLDGTLLTADNVGRLTYTLTKNTAVTHPGGLIQYDATDLRLLPFDSPQFAATTNQRAIAGALDRLETAAVNPALIKHLNTLTQPQLAAAIESLNPAPLVALFDLALQQTRTEHTQISQRLHNQLAARNTPASDPGFPFAAYFSLQTHRGSIDSTANSAGYDTDRHSLMIGFDRPFANNRARYGFAFTYTQGEADIDSNLGKIDLDAYRLTAYLGRLTSENIRFQGQAAVARNKYDIRRHVLGTTLESDTTANQLAVGAELGKIWDLGKNWQAGPLVRLNYDQLWLNDFGEAALFRYKSQNPRSLESQLAARITRAWQTQTAARLHLDLQIGWAHEYADSLNRLETTLVGTPSTLDLKGPVTARDSVHLNLSFYYQTAARFRAALNYETRHNSDQTTHALSLTLAKPF